MKYRIWGIIITGLLYLTVIPFWGHGWLFDMVVILAFALFINTLFSPWVVKKSRWNPFTKRSDEI